jgi:hypothetical protein
MSRYCIEHRKKAIALRQKTPAAADSLSGSTSEGERIAISGRYVPQPNRTESSVRTGDLKTAARSKRIISDFFNYELYS